MASDISYPRLFYKNNSTYYSLSKRIIIIGSDENCSIKISDEKFPKRAAHILYEQGTYQISQLSTDLKIKKNSESVIKQCDLKHGDQIFIGNHEFSFEENSNPAIAKQHDKLDSFNKLTNAALYELTSAIVSILRNRDQDVFSDLVTSISKLLRSDAARLVFDDCGTRQTITRYPQESGLDRFSNKAIDWAKGREQTVLVNDDQWDEPSLSIAKNKVASILCAPLKEGDAVIGYLYLDRLKSNIPFSEDDRALCDSLVPLFSEILSNHTERQRQQATIGRFQRQLLIQSGGMIYSCASMQKTIELAAKFSKTDSPVLILGETGTGKELLARLLHEKSPRSGKPFKAINCGAIPETLIESELFGYEKGAFTGANARKIGILEAGNEGSIFLDEIGELPIQMQVKLLRALQENEIIRLGGHDALKISVRIIAATNRNLQNEIALGRFRQDLFFRLNVLSLTLPPLRDRDKDILLLADYFNVKFCQQFGLPLKTLTQSAQNRLLTYDWPGNVRELENVIQKAILLSSNSKITADSIPVYTPSATMTLKEARSTAERELICTTLKKTNGNISLSAKLLEIDRKWLMKIMDDLGIKIEEYRNN